MKLIIQIPCYNEEKDILKTLNDLPSEIQGIDKIEILIINDGSKDDTLNEVKKYNGHRLEVLNLPVKRGLSNAFINGIEYSLKLGADIIVNTDGDNQYDSKDICKLVEPILQRKSDIVIGARNFNKIQNFSKVKIFFQNLGSKVISIISGTRVDDATSGFRAFSKEAASSLNVFNNFTYTHETILQASYNNFIIKSIPINTNLVERPSRLFKSNFEYILKSSLVILRVFMIYKPFLFFLILSFPFLISGLVLEIQWIFEWFEDKSLGLIPRLFLGAMLITISILLIIAGIFADLISTNRKMLEEIKKKLKK